MMFVLKNMLAHGFHRVDSNYILSVVGDLGKWLRSLQLHLKAYEVTGFNQRCVGIDFGTRVWECDFVPM